MIARLLSFSLFALVAIAAMPIAATPIAAQPVAPQARFALLVANVSYQPGVGELKNPKHDIDAVQGALIAIGFPRENVRQLVNATADQLRQELQAHVDRVDAAGVEAISFFYYSGHGVAAPKGTPGASGNYIIPIDVDTTMRPDFWQRAVALDDVNSILMKARQAKHLIFFDACRNELKVPTKGIRGFQPVTLSQEVEMLLAFATSPNTPAYDAVGQSHNGPYALALAQEIVKPGLDHLHLFANVRTEVMNKTLRTQVPWVVDGILTPLILHLPPPGTPGTDKCDAHMAAVTTKEVPLVWTDLPDKSWIRFKAHGFTYELPRTNARLIEEVEERTTHRIASGTRISVGSQDGEVAWYRYQRDTGSARPRYVVASEVELR